MRGAREFLLARLRAIGLEDVRLLDAPGGQPAVFGAWTGAGPGQAHHHDLRPLRRAARRSAGALALAALRADDPRRPDLCARRLRREGLHHGRDRGGGRLPRGGGRLPRQREAVPRRRGGGRQPEPARDHRSATATCCAADAMLSADGGGAAGTVPALNIGCRGIARCSSACARRRRTRIPARSAARMRNALHEMARLVASLHDEQGRVAVEGFEDGAAPAITNALRAEAASLPLDEAAWYAEFGAAPFGDPAYTVRERTTLRPTVEVNGMWGGYTGARRQDRHPRRGACQADHAPGPGPGPGGGAGGGEGASGTARARRRRARIPATARAARAPSRWRPTTRCAPRPAAVLRTGEGRGARRVTRARRHGADHHAVPGAARHRQPDVRPGQRRTRTRMRRTSSSACPRWTRGCVSGRCC